jgi:hypothetical protein
LKEKKMMQLMNEGNKMSPENFIYWLTGFFELTNETKLTEAQVKMIKEHLQLVTSKVTPPLNLPGPIDYTPVQPYYPYINPPLTQPPQPYEPYKTTITCSSGSSQQELTQAVLGLPSDGKLVIC